METETNLILNAEEQQKINEVAEIEKVKFEIDTPEKHQRAGEYLKTVSKKVKEIEEIRLRLTRPIDQSKKTIMDFFSPIIDRLKIKKDTISTEIGRYETEQQKIREEQERKMRELQDKEAERLRKLAEKQEERGDSEKALETQRKLEEVKSAPIVVAAPMKLKGIATTDNWQYRIIDLSKVDRQWLCIDDVKMGKFAKSTKGEIKVEGVEFFNLSSTHSTGR